LHAGEETFGAIDNVFRHSITSFASMHFCSTSQYAERVHEIKKDAKDVYVVGAPSLDGIYKLNLLSKVELSDFCGMDIQVPTGLVTFHPQTFSKSNLADIEEFIKGLEVLDLKYIITASNVDEGGDLFNTKLKAFCRKKPKERVFIPSMGKIPYFSAMKYADIMIGNSSSGIIEAVAYNLPVVNVGTRQDGRFKTTNISDVPLDSKKIVEISTRLLRRKKASFKNPYVAHPSSSELIFRRINDYLEESI
jgi:UDP-hydrolysing UDP-N-acetyl-D-glucosamine 2-epimerase